MARRQLPIVQPFTLGRLPWTFRDYRTVGGNEKAMAMHLMREHALAMSNATTRRPPVEKCGANDAERDAALARFLVLQDADPSYTFDQFKADGGMVYNELCPRPRAPKELIFVAMRQGEVEGAISIGNIRVEREDDTLRITGQPSPGFPAVGQRSQAFVWGRVLRLLLAQDLAFANGKTLDIVGWDMPQSREFRWSTRDSALIGETFAQVESVADKEVNAEEPESPKRFRRATAPPRETLPDDEPDLPGT